MVAHDRPEPYDEDRHRWMIPGWVHRIGLPRGGDGWFFAVVGGLIAIAVLAAAWRQAVAHWYVALPVLAVVWWLADR